MGHGDYGNTYFKVDDVRYRLERTDMWRELGEAGNWAMFYISIDYFASLLVPLTVCVNHIFVYRDLLTGGYGERGYRC